MLDYHWHTTPTFSANADISCRLAWLGSNVSPAFGPPLGTEVCPIGDVHVNMLFSSIAYPIIGFSADCWIYLIHIYLSPHWLCHAISWLHFLDLEHLMIAPLYQESSHHTSATV